MRKNSKGFNNNLVSYLCKFSGTLYAIAIISSCNNGKKYKNINEKQYMPTEGRGRNSGGSGSANKETFPSKKTPIDKFTERKNNNCNEVLSDAIDHQNDTIPNNNGDISELNCSKDDEKKSNYSNKDQEDDERFNEEMSFVEDCFNQKKDVTLSPEDLFGIVPVEECCADEDFSKMKSVEDQKKDVILFPEDLFGIVAVEEYAGEDFSKMKSVCPKCGILLDYGETGDQHQDFPDDHLLISIKDAADYVYDFDLKVFMENLTRFKEFIGQLAIILDQRKDGLKSAIKVH